MPGAIGLGRVGEGLPLLQVADGILGAAEQGRGIGAAVIRPVLDRCDADGLPAYLESSNEQNLSFYARHGFRQLWEDRPAPDGPVFRGMWRDPS